MDGSSIDKKLHDAENFEALDQEIMSLALQRTGARNGALFLWDPRVDGLVIACHIVRKLTVTIPDTVLRRDKPGIALWVYDHNEPYLVRDTSKDPNYTRYLQDVHSIAAVPICYQKRPIGVITVSSTERDAFDQEDIESLVELASSAAKFVRRAQLDRQSVERTGRPFFIKGLSEAWLEVERRIENASPTNAPVLIHGESGTGKDLVASAIHFNSTRCNEPFVTVNCAAIPENLLESILFGHVKGAFTGATFTKLGEFKKADGGTLFLDEVGELPLLLQAKVLRAVEQGEILALGSNAAPEHVDVRLLCATNRDLERMAGEGTFRADLYYRLSVMTMELPPLRSYKDDNLEVLANVFLQQAAQKHNVAAPEISTSALSVLQNYEYPGNVRELKNAMEHAVIMAGPEIEPKDLPQRFILHADTVSSSESSMPDQSLQAQREEWLAPLERRYLTNLLEACQGNVRKAAQIAGINHVTMYRLLKKRGLSVGRQVRDTES
jgi:transcriptional regulator with GAF, ATPase, and Fis domain